MFSLVRSFSLSPFLTGIGLFRNDTSEVIHRIVTLLRGNEDLIHGFNWFLPTGYSTDLESNAFVKDRVEGVRSFPEAPDIRGHDGSGEGEGSKEIR